MGDVHPFNVFLLAGAVLIASVHLTRQPGELVGLFALLVLGLVGPVVFARLARRLGDVRLRRLSVAFSLKLLIGTVLLFYGWTPELPAAAGAYDAYDPQRYYYQAQALADAGFDPAALPALNYTGILYYFGIAFELLGENPLVPYLVNSVTTLVATIFLVRLAYAMRVQPRPTDWTVGLAMLVPEVMWFDALPSRETLTMALVIIPLAAIGLRAVAGADALRFSHVLLSVVAVLLLAIVRTPVVLPLVAGACLIALSAPSRPHDRDGGRVGRTVGVALLALAALTVTPLLAARAGSFTTSFQAATSNVIGASAGGYAFSENSLAVRFAPDNLLELILFAPIRVVLYIVAPFPEASVSWAGLASGSWADWQDLAAGTSSVIYISLAPLLLGGAIVSIRRAAARAITAPALLLLVSVAMNNIIIVPRYRLMAVPLLLGTAWLGREMGRGFLQAAYLAWAALLASGLVIFLATGP